MLYVLVEQEGDWALHLYLVSKKLPYIFLLATNIMLNMGQITSKIEKITTFDRGKVTSEYCEVFVVST